ncbi:signal peptide peptidase SppA [Candidatus Babela massiliensis]|uniref:Periplasmic serine protease (ClpP class) n=1 Tax=Candidatus Babela massiliensis TaxID=673862 RepID=V6DFR3_9BACT|nr:signal peptide peptidase SppA [Candidatus Babela massiliensis]CDK30410.1 Periplasmic serine protease (ClpP class) [Candidatus Babela massiliensis]
MPRFVDYLKNIFFILVLLQVAPSLIKNLKKQYSNVLEAKTKVGVITIKDALYNSDDYVSDIKDYFKDKSIKALVLKINCPGGAAGTSQAIFNEIKHWQGVNNKYVIAFVENLAASGGYYVASAANYIISTPGAFIGSIGSYIAHPMFKDFIEQFKVKYEVIKSGDYKTVGNPFLETTDAQRQMLQGLSDNVYKQFVHDVAIQRPKLSGNVKEWADGRIFTGQQALQIGLVDELGSQSTVITALKEKVGITTEIEWVKPKKRGNFIQTLLSNDDDSDSKFQTSIMSKVYNLFHKYFMYLNY